MAALSVFMMRAKYQNLTKVCYIKTYNFPYSLPVNFLSGTLYWNNEIASFYPKIGTNFLTEMVEISSKAMFILLQYLYWSYMP